MVLTREKVLLLGVYSPVGAVHCFILGVTQEQYVGMPPQCLSWRARCLNVASWFERLPYHVYHFQLMCDVSVRALLGLLYGVWDGTIPFGIGYYYTSGWVGWSVCSVRMEVRSAFSRRLVSTPVVFRSKPSFYRRLISLLFLQLARDVCTRSCFPHFLSTCSSCLSFFVFSSLFFFLSTHV